MIEIFESESHSLFENKKISLLFIVLVLLVWLFSHWILIGINVSPSLPYRLFLIVKYFPIHKANYVAFYPHKNPIYPQQRIYVKQVKGKAGDRVSQVNGHYYINDHWQGKTLPYSHRGFVLHRGPVGIIPPGKYYVSALHPASFDSRYAEIGWVDQRAVIGRAFAISRK